MPEGLRVRFLRLDQLLLVLIQASRDFSTLAFQFFICFASLRVRLRHLAQLLLVLPRDFR